MRWFFWSKDDLPFDRTTFPSTLFEQVSLKKSAAYSLIEFYGSFSVATESLQVHMNEIFKVCFYFLHHSIINRLQTQYNQSFSDLPRYSKISFFSPKACNITERCRQKCAVMLSIVFVTVLFRIVLCVLEKKHRETKHFCLKRGVKWCVFSNNAVLAKIRLYRRI